MQGDWSLVPEEGLHTHTADWNVVTAQEDLQHGLEISKAIEIALTIITKQYERLW